MINSTVEPNYLAISVESRKGGVGKTTAALVLANVLVDHNFRVLVIDADITGTNTALAVQSSPIWARKAMLLRVPGTQDDPVELLNLFDAFVSGENIAEKLRSSFVETLGKSVFHIIGSHLVETNEKNYRSAAILFDELHSYWFRVFLEELAEVYAWNC